MTPTVTPTLPPAPFDQVLLPAVFYRHSAGEPNNSCADAHKIFPNNLYYFYPDDAEDWYTFSMASAGTITVRVDDFTPIAGQVALYKGSNCGNLLFLANNGDYSTTKIVQVGSQQAGRFFIFVSNDGSPNDVDPYELRVQVGP
jgi:hypothetical protein